MAAKLQEKPIQIFNVKQQQKKIRNEWLISKIYCNFYLSIFTLNFFSLIHMRMRTNFLKKEKIRHEE